jgi:hypothetical protein
MLDDDDVTERNDERKLNVKEMVEIMIFKLF